MLTRSKLLILLVILFGLGALGCSSNSDLSPVTPQSEDTLVAQSDLTVTSGTLSAIEGMSIPLADVYVDGELSTVTDEDGAYDLALTPGEHTLAFGYDDIIIHETTVSTDSRSVMQWPDPPATGAVAGTVYGKPIHDDGGDDDDDEFLPVEDAIVLVIDNDRHWIGADRTDEEGKFLIRKAPAGASTIIVFARGYVPWSEKMFINPDTLQYKDVYLRRAPHLGHILGLVRDPDFKPLSGVHIIVTDPDNPDFVKHALSEEFGAFFVNKLIPGTYVLHARLDGYEPVDFPIDIHRGRNFVKFRMFPEEGDPGGGGD